MMKFDVDAAIKHSKVDPSEEILEPPVMVYIETPSGDQVPLCTLGNLSLLMGKAKSYKTFLMTSIVAAAICGRCGIVVIKGLPAGKVLYFDTEQSRHHLQRTIRRICKQTGIDNPENLICYGLRPFTPSERIKIIEYLITNTTGLSFVVIDGIRDLLSKGINDEAESTELVSKFLKWTYEYNIHIATVLHQNKNDQNARGHVGTEIMNKAETVLSVSRDPKNKSIAIVTPEYCRDIDFESFFFVINHIGLPESFSMIETIDNRKYEKLKQNFEYLLPGMVTMSYQQLVDEYMQLAAVKNRAAGYAIRDARIAGIISKNGNGEYKQNSVTYENTF